MKLNSIISHVHHHHHHYPILYCNSNHHSFLWVVQVHMNDDD